MKKVIIAAPVQDFTLLTNCQIDKFYGAVRQQSKGFFIRDKYMEGNYKLVSASTGLTFANSFCGSADTELNQTIQKVMEKGFQVFEFDTAKELFAWLAE